MEQATLDLIEKNRKSNYMLNKLYEEHLSLESKIEDYESRKGLSVEDEKELLKLKKKKLVGKDKLFEIIETL